MASGADDSQLKKLEELTARLTQGDFGKRSRSFLSDMQGLMTQTMMQMTTMMMLVCID